MFATDRVRLRPRTPDDASNLYRLHSDPELHLITDGAPFIPRSLEVTKARLEKAVSEPDDGSTSVLFVAETAAEGTFLGGCSLWGIDSFNRLAHIGISLLPDGRGQGYGRDVVSLLCRYGFRSRNLRRIELETLASNRQMRSVAEACGFVHEGTQREREYDGDGFADIVIYGLLRSDWKM